MVPGIHTVRSLEDHGNKYVWFSLFPASHKRGRPEDQLFGTPHPTSCPVPARLICRKARSCQKRRPLGTGRITSRSYNGRQTTRKCPRTAQHPPPDKLEADRMGKFRELKDPQRFQTLLLTRILQVTLSIAGAARSSAERKKK